MQHGDVQVVSAPVLPTPIGLVMPCAAASHACRAASGLHYSSPCTRSCRSASFSNAVGGADVAAAAVAAAVFVVEAVHIQELLLVLLLLHASWCGCCLYHCDQIIYQYRKRLTCGAPSRMASSSACRMPEVADNSMARKASGKIAAVALHSCVFALIVCAAIVRLSVLRVLKHTCRKKKAPLGWIHGRCCRTSHPTTLDLTYLSSANTKVNHLQQYCGGLEVFALSRCAAQWPWLYAFTLGRLLWQEK